MVRFATQASVWKKMGTWREARLEAGGLLCKPPWEVKKEPGVRQHSKEM